METQPIPLEEFQRRVITPDRFVADSSAFLDVRLPDSDVRLPDSDGKHNYSFIGSGVSQNPDQVVNVREPHGFNIRAAGAPPGTVNSQHFWRDSGRECLGGSLDLNGN